jgi:hypothetical protein
MTLEQLAGQPEQQPVVEQQTAPLPYAGPDDTIPTSQEESPSIPAEETAQPAWAEQLRSAGIDPSEFRSEADLAAALAQQQQYIREMSPYAQYGQQVMPYAQQVAEVIGGRKAPEPAKAEPSEPAKSLEDRLREHWNSIWDKPQYDPAWETQVQINTSTGMFEGVSPLVPATVVQGMNSYRDWQRKALNSLITDPFDLTWKAIKPGVEDVVKSLVQQELSSYRTANDFDAIEKQYEGVLYEHDPNGNRVVDPATGGYKWSPFGQFTVGKMQELRQMGITDPYRNFNMALDLAKAYLFDQQSAEPTPAAAAVTQPPAGSMYANAPAAVAPQQSFLNRARQIASHSGGAAAPATPSGPAIQSFENESFFSKAATQLGLLQPTA